MIRVRTILGALLAAAVLACVAGAIYAPYTPQYVAWRWWERDRELLDMGSRRTDLENRALHLLGFRFAHDPSPDVRERAPKILASGVLYDALPWERRVEAKKALEELLTDKQTTHRGRRVCDVALDILEARIWGGGDLSEADRDARCERARADIERDLAP